MFCWEQELVEYQEGDSILDVQTNKAVPDLICYQGLGSYARPWLNVAA